MVRIGEKRLSDSRKQILLQNFIKHLSVKVREFYDILPSMEPTRLVMVVDDEREIENMLGRQLQRGGYDHVSFHDPRKAIEFFADNHDHLDLAILDVKMPVLTGIEMAHLMFNIGPSVPIILITGFSEDIEEEIGDNIKKVLRKPVPSKQLIDSVKEYIDS